MVCRTNRLTMSSLLGAMRTTFERSHEVHVADVLEGPELAFAGCRDGLRMNRSFGGRISGTNDYDSNRLRRSTRPVKKAVSKHSPAFPGAITMMYRWTSCICYFAVSRSSVSSLPSARYRIQFISVSGSSLVSLPRSFTILTLDAKLRRYDHPRRV